MKYLNALLLLDTLLNQSANFVTIYVNDINFIAMETTHI